MLPSESAAHFLFSQIRLRNFRRFAVIAQRGNFPGKALLERIFFSTPAMRAM
jgi:hypothetical protein